MRFGVSLERWEGVAPYRLSRYHPSPTQLIRTTFVMSGRIAEYA